MRMRLAVPLCIPRRAGWTMAARALGICLVMAMSACGRSNSNPAGASGGTGSTGGSGSGTSNKTVTVTIDGVAFVPTLVTAVRSNPGVETALIVGFADGDRRTAVAGARVDWLPHVGEWPAGITIRIAFANQQRLKTLQHDAPRRKHCEDPSFHRETHF